MTIVRVSGLAWAGEQASPAVAALAGALGGWTGCVAAAEAADWARSARASGTPSIALPCRSSGCAGMNRRAGTLAMEALLRFLEPALGGDALLVARRLL